MDKKVMHTEAIKMIKEKLYSGVFDKTDIRSDEKIYKDRGSGDEYQGFDVKDPNNKKIYIITSNDVEKMPIRVKKSKKIIDSRKVYWVVDQPAYISVPESDIMSTKEFVDYTFPLKHTEPLDLTIAKILIITNTISKSFSRIITKQGFGKDGIFSNIQNVINKGSNVTEASDAKLGTVIDGSFAAFNEISGYSGETRRVLQRFFLATAETNALVYEHTTTGSDRTRSRYDISKFGYSVLHNTTEYYMTKGLPTFEQMFTPAIFYRIFPVELMGQVDDPEFIGNQFNANKFVNDNITFYERYIGKWHFLRNNFKSVVCPFNLSKYTLQAQENEKVSRWLSSFNNIAKMTSLYSDSEQEFYTIMDLIYKRHKDYIEKLKVSGLI